MATVLFKWTPKSPATLYAGRKNFGTDYKSIFVRLAIGRDEKARHHVLSIMVTRSEFCGTSQE
ncbi:MAG: hypothetical protein AB1664_19250, partial [Thermodesulfobacteriota bacterium]